jgi:hypothetical protein
LSSTGREKKLERLTGFPAFSFLPFLTFCLERKQQGTASPLTSKGGGGDLPFISLLSFSEIDYKTKSPSPE